MRDTAERLEAFKPTGRTEVPVRVGEIPKLSDKTEVAFVDTLDMQTKLGTKNREAEESMTLMDSKIVRGQPVLSGSRFSADQGTVKVVGMMPDHLPNPLDLASNMERKRESDMQRSVPLKGQVPGPLLRSIQELRPGPIQEEIAERSRENPVVIHLPPAPPEVELPKHEPIVVDQGPRIAELETENAVLLGIVARLAAENKILKAKK